MRSIQDNIRALSKESEARTAENGNLQKLVAEGFSRKTSVIPGVMSLPSKGSQKVVNINAVKPVDYSKGMIDWSKSGNIDLMGRFIIEESITPEPSTLLLDLYPDAAAAYSLRKLRAAYAGSAIRVRRSSDNTETDIGFVDNELDTVSLLAFVGDNDGFVTTWYDQSGEGNDASQVLAGNQPKIVSSGSLIVENGKPSIYFSGTNYLTNGAGTTTPSNVSAFAVRGFSSYPSIYRSLFNYKMFGLTYNSNGGAAYGNGAHIFKGTTSVGKSDNYPRTTGQALDTIIDKDLLQRNGISASISEGGTYANGVSSIGSWSGISQGFIGNLQELILYDLDQSANITAIETNINSHYNIYWDGSQAGLLDSYPNASAAYSLRALNSSYTGAAIRVRRSSDNAEQDIKLLYDGSLDTSSLLSFVGAGDGFVSTWYDQSEENNDFTQPSASLQPIIVNSGLVITTNGKPSITMNGSTSNMYIFNNSLSPLVFRNISDSISFISVEKPNIITGPNGGWFNSKTLLEIRSNNITAKVPISFGYSDSKIGYGATDNYVGDAEIIFSSTITNNQKVLQSFVDNDLVQIFSNGNSVGSGSFVAASSDRSIGTENSTISLGVRSRDGGQLDNSYYSGNIQEIILYKTNKLSDRTAMESNINSHYSIY